MTPQHTRSFEARYQRTCLETGTESSGIFFWCCKEFRDKQAPAQSTDTTGYTMPVHSSAPGYGLETGHCNCRLAPHPHSTLQFFLRSGGNLV